MVQATPGDVGDHPVRSAPPGGLYNGWVLVAMLGITQTVTWGLVYYSFSVFLPAMQSDLGWSRGEMWPVSSSDASPLEVYSKP